MTTTVTVDAHVGWPVQVQAIDDAAPGSEITDPIVTELETVQPGEVKDFHVHSTRKLIITELPNE